MLLCTGLLFCELFHQPATLCAQEPLRSSGTRRFGSNRARDSSITPLSAGLRLNSPPQIPPNKLQKEVTESAVCWYVKASRIRSGGNDEATPESDGKLVISAHHVRFIPHIPQLAGLYADLQPERIELQHQPGDAYATLGSKDFAFSSDSASFASLARQARQLPPV
jgi:hypothetical protein